MARYLCLFGFFSRFFYNFVEIKEFFNESFFSRTDFLEPVCESGATSRGKWDLG